MSGEQQSVVSSKLSAKVHASQTKMPQCTRTNPNPNPDPDPDPDPDPGPGPDPDPDPSPSPDQHASQTKIKMPQCTWAAAGADGSSALLATKESDAPLGVDARRASLQAIASSRSRAATYY